jgi:hypothetical protein
MATKRKSGSRLKGAGRKLDSLLFGIPENRSKFMRTGKNPAARKRGAYRLGLEAARRNPAGDPGSALVAAERTIIFREAAVTDLAGARSFFLAGYQDGAQENPKAKSAFDRCVASVASKNGAGKRKAARSKRNPGSLSKAEAAHEGFHGEKATHTFKLQERRHVHDVVWAFGPLVYLKVWLPADRRKQGLRNFVEIEFDYEGKNPVLVTANEKRNQMFFDGGDQSVSLSTFGVPKESHETVVLGEVSDAYYFTTKTHLGDQGGTAVYKHKLGEEGGELPTLIYHTLEKRLSLAGGSYTIPNEGVRN